MPSEEIDELARRIAAFLQPDALLTKEEAAELLGCSVSTFDAVYRKIPTFPPPFTEGLPVSVRVQPRWRQGSLSDWIQAVDPSSRRKIGRRRNLPAEIALFLPKESEQ